MNQKNPKSCPPVTTTGNTIATVYQETLFQVTPEFMRFFCFNTIYKQIPRTTNGMTENQNITQFILGGLFPMIPTVVRVTLPRHHPWWIEVRFWVVLRPIILDQDELPETFHGINNTVARR